MNWLAILLLAVIVWLLWRIVRNTGDALDRQAAMQTELTSIERRLARLEAGKDENPG
ncbi:hypothetical protein [uncultured Halovibrio sp.]|uniref:hypothetical protein n=1 Tax=uncultured Halovibrio sp. TaxID=985049 RepID=UPI0025DD29E3|nr:hypothetical protein [uncultured Halovibrio sp.]